MAMVMSGRYGGTSPVVGKTDKNTEMNQLQSKCSVYSVDRTVMLQYYLMYDHLTLPGWIL